jgi:hypothetical protein
MANVFSTGAAGDDGHRTPHHERDACGSHPDYSNDYQKMIASDYL